MGSNLRTPAGWDPAVCIFGGSLAESLYNVYFWRKPYFFHAGAFFWPVSRKLYWFFAATPDSTVPSRETGYDWVRFRSVHVPDKLITQWMLRWGWGGVGCGSVNLPDTLITQWMLRWGWGGVGWGSVSFLDKWSTQWMLRWGWGGAGWGTVNLSGKLITQWMLRWGWGGVGWGSVITFQTRWSRSGCYVGVGVGWGSVNLPDTLITQWMPRWMPRCWNFIFGGS